MRGGSFIDPGAGIDFLTRFAFNNGGGIIDVRNADLSAITTIIGDVGATYNIEAAIHASFIRNKVNPAVTLVIIQQD